MDINWDFLYTMCRKHFNMSRDEFLYEHDLVEISSMLNQLFKDSSKEELPEEMPATSFL